MMMIVIISITTIILTITQRIVILTVVMEDLVEAQRKKIEEDAKYWEAKVAASCVRVSIIATLD